MNPKRHSESLGNYGNNFASFSANGFVLPQSVRRSSEFRLDFGDISPLSQRGHVCALQNRRLKSISGAKDTTTQKNTNAATLYENILTIQNAADLQFPPSNPANAGVRGQFLLGIFPPDHGGNHTPPPTPPATPHP